MQNVPPGSAWSPGMGTENEERQQHVFCYRAVVETRLLDLKERRENEDLKLVYLLPQPWWPRECLLDLGLR